MQDLNASVSLQHIAVKWYSLFNLAIVFAVPHYKSRDVFCRLSNAFIERVSFSKEKSIPSPIFLFRSYFFSIVFIRATKI